MGFLSDVFGGLAGAVIGGVSSFIGGAQANEANSAQAARSMAFTDEQQRRQFEFNNDQAIAARAWTQGMSDTAYRRSMKDMRKAGLNPILAYKQGGASAPSGASASGGMSSGSQAQMKDIVTPAMASAMQVATTTTNLKNIQAQTEMQQIRNRDLRLFGDGPGSGTAKSLDRAIRLGKQGVRTTRLPSFQSESKKRGWGKKGARKRSPSDTRPIRKGELWGDYFSTR